MAKSLEQVVELGRAGKLTAGSVSNLQRYLTEPFLTDAVPGIEKLLAAGDTQTLDKLFWEVLPFGTGGRRGEMSEFGSATMNARTIAESAWGLGTYVQRANPGKTCRAVIAYDTRHRSDEFARLSATVLVALGFEVHLFEGPRSTPELSFAVRHLHCDTGIMISASHNPPADNGFKAYWSTGGQVLAPHDQGIIDCVYQAREIPTGDYKAAVTTGQLKLIGSAVDEAYWQTLLKMSLGTSREVRAIYTPLHGVGESSVYQVLHRAGFRHVHLFEPQRSPNGRFPNVPDHLPNPERPQVFAPAIPLAKSQKAALILATDPDADRVAVMARDATGEYQFLTGNQTGALVLDYILRKRKAAGTLSDKHFVVETLVTSPLLGVLAKAYGCQIYDQLLVGFKYIGETIDRYGPEFFVFGAEESLGYLAGDYARDKDATIGALYIMELAAELAEAGQTILDRLDQIYTEHGVFAEGQVSKTCPGPTGKAQIDQIMATFRSQPPAELGGLKLELVKDYRQHEVRSLPANTRLKDLPEPSGELLIVDAVAADCRVSVALRPSGTEPKIKFYFFSRVAPGVPVVDGRKIANERMQQLRDGLNAWADQVTAGK